MIKTALAALRYAFKGPQAISDDQSIMRIRSMIPTDVDPLLFASWCVVHVATTDFNTYNKFIDQIRTQK